MGRSSRVFMPTAGVREELYRGLQRRAQGPDRDGLNFLCTGLPSKILPKLVANRFEEEHKIMSQHSKERYIRYEDWIEAVVDVWSTADRNVSTKQLQPPPSAESCVSLMPSTATVQR